MAPDRGDGIDLVPPERWVVDDLRDPVAFFRHLDCLIAAQPVQHCCRKTRATCRRERNENKRDLKVLRRLLWGMDNPGKVRMFWP